LNFVFPFLGWAVELIKKLKLNIILFF